MNINEMSGQEKSVLLAKAMGLEIEPHFAHPHDIFIKIPPEWDYEWELLEGDFYTAPMEISWRVLNWAAENEGLCQYFSEHRVWCSEHTQWETTELHHWWPIQELFDIKPAEAQRLWLDMVLTLVIEAGLVEVAE